LLPLNASAAGETAQRWGYADAFGTHDQAAGEIGVISSVTQSFCGDCNRARLSTEGKLYLCLFAQNGYDLKPLLRSDASDQHIADVVSDIWRARTDRYSELRSSLAPDNAGGARRVEMSYIGG
jgi:cyclic pyranopterin phosphate synthase